MMTGQFLSQDEVDALLEGANAPGESPSHEAADGVRPYDLATQERIVRGRMPTLELVHERFARNLRVGLFNFMRRNPEISVGPVKVQKYSAFLREIVIPTNINVMHVKPLRGSGLLICEPQLVFAVVDSLFGGDGRLHSRIEGRDFSATEQRIIERMLEVICTEYRKAWSGVHPIELEYTRSEMQPQFANIATPSRSWSPQSSTSRSATSAARCNCAFHIRRSNRFAKPCIRRCKAMRRRATVAGS